MAWLRAMRSLPLSNIKITGEFWSVRQDRLVAVTLPHIYDQLAQTPRLDNFRRAAGTEEGPHAGLPFDDSDIYKWLEACAYGLTIRNNPRLSARTDEVIALIENAQMADGYLNTFFQLKHPTMRWKNLNMLHEMYCAGHLFEAAAAWKECMNDERLLEVAVKLAQHISSVFGPNKRRGYCGHEEIEIGLIRLSEVTGDPQYRKFAKWQVEERGKKPSPFEAELQDPEIQALSPWGGTLLRSDEEYNGEYAQDHAPIREHTQIVGHAVRAMYLYTAATELADGEDDAKLETAIETIWGNLTQRRMYITGGIGPSARNEGFTADFDLPNLSAYAETCASCGLILWGHRLLQLSGTSDYADLMERALYNGAISGISLSGDTFFYDNPLESRGGHARKPWFTCACCPPNIARVIGNLGQYVAGISESTFYVHIPCGMEADVDIAGQRVRVIVESNYPWSGKCEIRVESSTPALMSIAVRIPEWSDEMESDLPDAENEADYKDGYAIFRKTWTSEDRLTIDLGLSAKWIEADPRVLDNVGRVALECGPLIYAAESVDNKFPPQLFTADLETEFEFSPVAALDGSFAITVDGWKVPASKSGALYGEADTSAPQPSRLTLIPYATWANRGPSHIQVWLRRP